MLFRQLFDPESSTYTYLLADESTREAVLIDPVLEQVDRDLEQIEALELKLVAALDTHVHADHVTALGVLRQRTGCTTVLSERAGSGKADRLVKEGDTISFGSHHLEVRETPGHTNGCLSYYAPDAGKIFTGDALLIRGCGRTDFQGGSASTLYRSVREKIFTLSEETLVYPAHDYRGRTVSTVREERRHNPRLKDAHDLETFVRIMSELSLAQPKKIDVAVPANLHAGVPPGLSVGAQPPPDRSWAPVERSAGGIPEVEPGWVAAHPRVARLVDVREADELVGELGKIAGSEHVPLADVGRQAADWAPDEPVVLVCRSGGRSGKAALELVSRGFTRVASMRGGMTEWWALRLPVDG